MSGDREPADLPRPSKPTRTRLLLSYVAGAFGLGASAMGNFLVPLRANELGAGFELIGLIVGAGALAPAIASVPLGSLVDRMGARRAFILGTLATAVIALLFMTAANTYALLVLQPLFGASRALAWIASQSYVANLGSGADSAGHTGKFSFFANVGPMIGPVLVGAAAHAFGFRAAFVVIAAYGTVFAMTGWLMQERSNFTAHPRAGVGFRTALGLVAVRAVQTALLLTFARLWIEWIWMAFFPVYAIQSGLTPVIAGAVVTAKGLVATIVAPSAGAWVRRIPAALSAAAGLGFGALGLALTPYFVEVPWVFASGAMIGVGTGLSLPLLLTIITGAVSPADRGVALGLRVSVNQVAATAAPVVVGPLIAALGPMLAFVLGGSFAALLLGLASVTHRSRGAPGAPNIMDDG